MELGYLPEDDTRHGIESAQTSIAEDRRVEVGLLPEDNIHHGIEARQMSVEEMQKVCPFLGGMALEQASLLVSISSELKADSKDLSRQSSNEAEDTKFIESKDTKGDSLEKAQASETLSKDIVKPEGVDSDMPSEEVGKVDISLGGDGKVSLGKEDVQTSSTKAAEDPSSDKGTEVELGQSLRPVSSDSDVSAFEAGVTKEPYLAEGAYKDAPIMSALEEESTTAKADIFDEAVIATDKVKEVSLDPEERSGIDVVSTLGTIEPDGDYISSSEDAVVFDKGTETDSESALEEDPDGFAEEVHSENESEEVFIPMKKEAVVEFADLLALSKDGEQEAFHQAATDSAEITEEGGIEGHIAVSAEEALVEIISDNLDKQTPSKNTKVIATDVRHKKIPEQLTDGSEDLASLLKVDYSEQEFEDFNRLILEARAVNQVDDLIAEESDESFDEGTHEIKLSNSTSLTTFTKGLIDNTNLFTIIGRFALLYKV